MEPKYVSAEELAELLTDMAQGISRDEFARLLEEILGNTDTGDMAQIACHMPPELLRLIPRRYLH